MAGEVSDSPSMNAGIPDAIPPLVAPRAHAVKNVRVFSYVVNAGQDKFVSVLCIRRGQAAQ